MGDITLSEEVLLLAVQQALPQDTEKSIFTAGMVEKVAPDLSQNVAEALEIIIRKELPFKRGWAHYNAWEKAYGSLRQAFDKDKVELEPLSTQEKFEGVMSTLAKNRIDETVFIEISNMNGGLAVSRYMGETVHMGTTLDKHIDKIMKRLEEEST